jgi:hypothetical protein
MNGDADQRLRRAIHMLEEHPMPIRSYQPGDEHAQAQIYNAVAGSLPAFKPSTADEITRRYRPGDPDSETRYYAVHNGEIVGYAAFSANGRISYPWCLLGAEFQREPLLETVLEEMRQRSLPDAWAAYRRDWSGVLGFLREHEFTEKHNMINYVAERSRLSAPAPLPSNRLVAPLVPEDLPELITLDHSLFGDTSVQELERFYWHNPFYQFPRTFYALKDADTGRLVGVYLLVVSDRFADPTKIDAAMPCFRLGAFGTERERHKRVNGVFSCLFADEADADLLASHAGAQAAQFGLTHVAAQVASDAASLCAWYDRYFVRQTSFPILSRPLTK